jgi:cytochrome P450
MRALLTGVIDGYQRAGADHDDLISILMRARDDDTGAGMTNKQLRDEATTLVIAGSETTGNTIAWACCLLAQHPQIRNCIGEGFAWAESTLLLSAIAARWQLRLADGTAVHPVISSTLVPSELPIIVTRRITWR